MKVVITGGTGMIGKGLLLECIQDPRIEKILLINRRSVGFRNEKLQEYIHSDFFNLSLIEDKIKGLDACFFCLGVSAVGMSEKDYNYITYELTTQFSDTILRLNPDITFCYISGAGTDSSEKGRSMWSRIKGKTENALLAMPFKKAIMFRPAFIQPMKGIKSSTKHYNLLYSVFKPLYPLLQKLFPAYVTNTTILGRAMINSIYLKTEKQILENKDINQLGF